jgi:hypothetical protein
MVFAFGFLNFFLSGAPAVHALRQHHQISLYR